MPTPSEIFTQLVTTTDRRWGSKVTDNVSNHNALLWKLRRKKNITFTGGYEIVEPLEYGENGTYQRYMNYDELNTDPSDILTSVKFPLQQIALHIVSNGRELRTNKGKERMINLVKRKKTNALTTAANQFAIDVYSDGTEDNQINGLANLIQADGTGTVGGIDASTWTFWRNKFREMTGTDLAASPSVANAQSLKYDMGRLWLQQVRGADKPDLIVASHDMYSLYEMGEQTMQRYASSEMAKAGFMTLKYKSADIIFDDNANFATTAEKMYFLNTQYLYLQQHREAQWTMDTEKRPVKQDAIVVPLYWMGNLVCTNRSLQGVLFDAA